MRLPRPRSAPAPVDVAFAAALERTGDGAFVTADDGRVVFWNRAAERILGYSAREASTKNCCELFGGYDGVGNRLCYPGCHIRTVVRLGEPVASYDMRTRTRAGTPVWLNVSVVPMPSQAEGARTLHLFRDVTAARELVALVHERATARPDGGGAASELTRRELEILRLLTQGLGTAAIADRLHVSRATVRNHIQSVFAKLDVHSRVAAVAYARTQHLF